jgi:hypothetical protein
MRQQFFAATFVLWTLLSLTSSASAQVGHPAIRDELVAMEKADQEARTKCTSGPQSEQMNCFIAITKAIDEPHAKRLTEIFNSIGFPDTAKVGKEGLGAVMTLLQHVPGDELRKKSLSGITRAFRNKEIPPMNYANFVDRLRLHQGKKQLYGSNFDFRDGKMVMSPTEDPKDLARRRAEIGLPTLGEYVQVLKEMYRMEVVVPGNK